MAWKRNILPRMFLSCFSRLFAS